jgi:hypothetical protein
LVLVPDVLAQASVAPFATRRAKNLEWATQVQDVDVIEGQNTDGFQRHREAIAIAHRLKKDSSSALNALTRSL